MQIEEMLIYFWDSRSSINNKMIYLCIRIEAMSDDIYYIKIWIVN